MEREWLKKRSGRSPDVLRTLIEPEHSELSVRRQCRLPGLSRSRLDYEPVPETEEHLQLMRRFDLFRMKSFGIGKPVPVPRSGELATAFP
jgi:hypothetical protein